MRNRSNKLNRRTAILTREEATDRAWAKISGPDLENIYPLLVSIAQEVNIHSDPESSEYEYADGVGVLGDMMLDFYRDSMAAPMSIDWYPLAERFIAEYGEDAYMDAVSDSPKSKDTIDWERYEQYKGRGASVQPAKTRRTASRPVGRFAAQRNAAKDDRAPGQVSGKLRRRMGDALADLFDEFGPEIYSETMLALKDVVLGKFQEGFDALDQTIKDELGTRGVEESREHIREWSSEIAEDVNHFGLDEVAGALEDLVGTLAAEFQQEGGEAGEGSELLDFGDAEEVAEEEVEEVPGAEAEQDELDLDAEDDQGADLADLGLDLEMPEAAAAAQPAAQLGFGPLGGRRTRPARRRFRRQANQQRAGYRYR